MERRFSLLQMIFIPLMLIFFICMNVGFVKYNDGITIISVIGMTIVSLATIWKNTKFLRTPMSHKRYVVCLWMIFIFFFVVQTLVCLYVPLNYYSDFIIIRDQVVHMSEEFNMLPHTNKYFQSYPYQLNIIFIINAIYSIFGSYKGVEIFTTALVNVSAVITAMTVCNMTHNRKISIIMAVMLNVFSTLCLKTYMPYTSNIGFIFPILMVYIYTSELKRTKKVILLALVVIVGSRVKITTCIPFIAMLIFGGYKLLKERDYKNIAVGLLSIVAFYIPVICVHDSMVKKIGFVYDNAMDHGFVYYFAMGQNNPTGGQYNYEIGVIGNNEFPSKEARDEFFLNMAIKSIRERSTLGQIKFFASKIAFCWGETYIDHLYFCKWDKFFLIIKHYTWYLAMTLMVIGTFFIRDKRYYMLLLGIWGVIAYLYLSEAGARYVLMYMPLVYVMAGITMKRLCKKQEFPL